MTVRIREVRGTSSFFRAGDEIVRIGGHRVADQLDVLFFASGEGSTEFIVEREGRTRGRTVSSRAFERAGLSFEKMRFIRCRSRCPFCFMDQMPPGMRPSLYEKDDDYRLSFLFGNFITLNDIADRDLGRIAALGLSPLYVSVHAVDRRIREKIFGRALRRDIVADMKRLARAGITMHAQIVLVPGVNDGSSLERTVAALGRLYPRCRSIAIVPVGLTAHRAGLPRLRAVTAAESRALISWAEGERERFRQRTGGERFVHLADELYLTAGRELPPAEAYDDFPQLANGVGMCRRFLEDLRRDIARMRGKKHGGGKMTVVTGVLGEAFMRRYAAPLLTRELPSFEPRFMTVRNALFGPLVGVSGLLAGRDILAAARRRRIASGCLVVPANALNHRGRFIDDTRPSDISGALGLPVLVARRSFLEPGILRRMPGGGST